MAWQLIYTSAPRLLEAGRSGFGTVARHRAIHPLLVTTLERDSQFDRAAAAGRVIFAHRILTAAGARCHVLTCIRDAGADYTGRTNHIAHCKAALVQRLLDRRQGIARLVFDSFGHCHGRIIIAGRSCDEAPVALHNGTRISDLLFET